MAKMSRRTRAKVRSQLTHLRVILCRCHPCQAVTNQFDEELDGGMNLVGPAGYFSHATEAMTRV
jgi:hypothetical protein